MPPAQDAKRAEIARLYVDEGLSAPAIARRFGITLQAVTYHLQRAGVARRSPAESHPRKSLAAKKTPRSRADAVNCKRAEIPVQRTIAQPWCDLQRDVVAYCDRQEISRSEFGRQSGVPQGTLSNWFLRRGSALTAVNLARVATQLELGLDEARARSGTDGKVSEDRWGEQIRSRGERMRELFSNAPDSEEVRKVRNAFDTERQAQKGRKWSQERRASRKSKREAEVRAVRLAGGDDPAVKALSKSAKSTKMRIVHAMLIFLRHNPTPTEDQLSRRFREIARRRNLAPSIVSDYCRPYLKARSLRLKIGRPRADERREEEIRVAAKQWSRTRRDHGFWEYALERVRRIEGASAPTSGESLHRWARRRGIKIELPTF